MGQGDGWGATADFGWHRSGRRTAFSPWGIDHCLSAGCILDWFAWLCPNISVNVFGRKIQGAGGYSDKPADGVARAGRFALVIIILIRIINISDGGRGGELMWVAFLMRCDNACPLCPALDPTGCDLLDSATVAKMMQGEKIIGVSAVCGQAATHSPQDMLYPAFIPFMSTNAWHLH